MPPHPERVKVGYGDGLCVAVVLGGSAVLGVHGAKKEEELRSILFNSRW